MVVETLNICECCNKPTDASLSSYNGDMVAICENCDGFYEWCNVCETNHCVDFQSPCRHLYWTENGWQGAGSDDMNWSKDDFMALLKFLGADNAKQLKIAISVHKYWFQFYGSMFGVERINCELWDGLKMADCGQIFTPIFEMEDSEVRDNIANGINWLISLWAGTFRHDGTMNDYEDCQDGFTSKADMQTVEWIDEFLGENK